MRFQQRLRTRANVDLIPMIDVVFQLVIFFMVSTTFIVTPGIGIVFPASATAEPIVMTKLVVSVVSREEIYLNKEKYDIVAVSQKIHELREKEISEGADKSEDSQKTVVIEAHEEIPYKLLISVFDILRKNGYKAINLKTRELPGKEFDEDRSTERD